MGGSGEAALLQQTSEADRQTGGGGFPVPPKRGLLPAAVHRQHGSVCQGELTALSSWDTVNLSTAPTLAVVTLGASKPTN